MENRRQKDLRSRKGLSQVDSPAPLALPATRTFTSPDPILFAWIVLGYFALLLFGVAMLNQFGMRAGNQMSLGRAVFTASNALSLTGFDSHSMRPIDLSRTGRYIVFALSFSSIALTLFAAAVPLAAWTRSKLSVLKIAIASVACALAAIFLGSGALMQSGVGLYDATLNSLCAFGNSALHAGNVPSIENWRTWVVLIPLSIAGSFGVLALTDLVFGKVTSHTRRTALLIAGGYLVSMLILASVMLLNESGANVAGTSSAMAISTRTLGLPFVEVRELPRAVQWTLIPLMMVGGPIAGLAGGIKVATLYVIGENAIRAFRRKPVSRSLTIALVWLGAYLVLFLVISAMLLMSETQLATDQAPFLAASALSCVGLSRDPVSITGGGLYVLSLAMMLGRVLPLGVLWWSVATADDEDWPVG